jgi:hypothetical protein
MAEPQRGKTNMNTTYKFAPVPSNSMVAGLVTSLVSVWFLVAAAAIFADPVTRGAHPTLTEGAAAARVAIAPEARLTITVEAQRLKS